MLDISYRLNHLKDLNDRTKQLGKVVIITVLSPTAEKCKTSRRALLLMGFFSSAGYFELYNPSTLKIFFGSLQNC